MENLRLESDREYVKNQVCKHIDRFFDDLKGITETLAEQKNYISKLKYSQKILARAYAVELGVLVTKKQFEKIIKANKKP